MGLPVSAILLINGISIHSNEAILYAGTFNFSKKFNRFWISSNFMYSRSLNYQWDLDDTATPYYHPGNDVNNFHMTLKLAYLIPMAK